MSCRLELIEIRKSFQGKEVLKDISMYCESGKIYGIIGFNGSGKSVLFKCITGLMRYDSGSVIVNGKPKKKGELLENAGIIIETPSFLSEKSGFDNLRLLYMIKNVPNKEYLMKILKRVGLEKEAQKKVGKYSLGMKQRLAIAQAIMENQEILILDEPFNSLDYDGVIEMRALLKELKNEGKLIFLSSHNREDVQILCDEVYILNEGKLIKK